MPLLKTIALRLLLFIAVLASLNYIYSKLFFDTYLEDNSDIFRKIQSIPKASKVLYIGESSNITYRANDVDKRSISALLADYYPNLQVADITQPGAHAGTYLGILQAIPENKEIETIVLTLNYRSFGAEWIYSELENALIKKIVLLKNQPALYKRFNLSIKAFEAHNLHQRDSLIKDSWLRNFTDSSLSYKNADQWNKDKRQKGILDSVNNFDYDKTALACSFIKSFAFEIKPDNPRVKDFDAIVALCKKRNWHLVLNLMPEDLELANNLVGSELVSLMNKNRDLLVKRYTEKGATIVDNFNDVPHIQFVDKDFPTEHYAIKGRRIVAKNVAQNLKNLYPHSFVNIKYEIEDKSSFYHDCEKNEIWGQMQSITTLKNEPKNHVSAFGSDHPFSLTFQYPFNKIADSLKNSILISFKTKGIALPDSVMLAIELSGESVEFLWSGKPFSELLGTKYNEWQTASFEFKIPETYKNAGLIKVYGYNPNNYLYYLDDFSIEFK